MSTAHQQQQSLNQSIAFLEIDPQTRESADNRVFKFVCSTGVEDAYGRVVVQDWDLSRFQKNPVVFWNHGGLSVDESLPIGRAISAEIVDAKLVAEIEIATAEANPLAEKVYQGLVQKTINAVSVGWNSGKVAIEERDGKPLIVMSQNQLVEISIVGTPANPETVRASLNQQWSALLAQIEPNQRERNMEKYLSIAGLPANTAEEVFLAKLVEGNQAITQLKEVQAELAKERATRRELDVASVLAEALNAGRVTPANRAKVLMAAGATDDGIGADPDRLRAIVEVLPAQVNTGSATQVVVPTPSVAASDTAGLTESERARCRANGWDQANYAKNKAATLFAVAEQQE